MHIRAKLAEDVEAGLNHLLKTVDTATSRYDLIESTTEMIMARIYADLSPLVPLAQAVIDFDDSEAPRPSNAESVELARGVLYVLTTEA